jgi:biopolymer transport protein ExbB
MMTPTVKKLLIGSGITTVGGPMLGLLGTVLGMMKSFQALNQSGAANMEGLSAAIAEVLMYVVIGCAIGFIGFITLIVTLIIWLANRDTPPPLHQ